MRGEGNGGTSRETRVRNHEVTKNRQKERKAIFREKRVRL